MGDLSLACRLFGIRVIDYERPAKGLLIGSGAGIMLAVMDACPNLRLCLDVDECAGDLACWLRCLARNGLIDLLAIAGWFSITDPAVLAGAVRAVPVPTLIYVGGGIGAEHFIGGDLCTDNLDIFLAEVQKKRAAPEGAAGTSKLMPVVQRNSPHREVPETELAFHRNEIDAAGVAQHPAVGAFEPSRR